MLWHLANPASGRNWPIRGLIRVVNKIVNLPSDEVFMSKLRQSLIFPPLALVVCFIMSLPLSGRIHAQTSSRVTLDSVDKVFIAENHPAYLVSFSYDFSITSTVYIKGLGVVPAKGRYQYLSDAQALEFWDPATNSELEKVPLKETIYKAAKPPLNEVPSQKDFSPGFRSYTWELPTSLQERANQVLAHYFLYLPQENNRLTYLTTTFAPLTLSKKLTDSGVMAQLALLLSFPYDPTTGKYSFHIQYAAKEGRALSDELRPTSNVEILKAANDFVDKIVAEMKSERSDLP
jgi:hypothetical protein